MYYLRRIQIEFSKFRKNIYKFYIKKLLGKKNGIEFGGPTALFSDKNFNFQIYNYLKLDGANLFNENYFQQPKNEKFEYGNSTGKQFEVDVSSYSSLQILKKKYGFILNSHLIEHLANPLNSLKLWHGVLEEDGYLISVVPDYRYSFDRKRPLTQLEHFIQDYQNKVSENDTTHVDEQLRLHDWELGGMDNFEELVKKNEETRVLHHHTFTKKTLIELLELANFTTIISFKIDKLNIVNIAKKINDCK